MFLNALVNLPYSHRRYTAPVPQSPALLIRGLCVNRPTENALAIDHLSLKVPIGARIALVGPNGAGKSTLLKTIAGLLPIREGSIDIYGLPRGACHHRVAYLPQRGQIDWSFPVSLYRLVMTGRFVHLGWLKRPLHEDRVIVDHVIERMGLATLKDRQIGQLSGGQQQRALLARALAQGADLILLDEPMSAVDVETQVVIESVLDELQAKKKTLIIATHDLDTLHHYDGVLYLRDGCEVPPPPEALPRLLIGSAAVPTHP
jgi:manganese/zinc/iron transport system ATP- binding protein